jgi:hypothetical protein
VGIGLFEDGAVVLLVRSIVRQGSTYIAKSAPAGHRVVGRSTKQYTCQRASCPRQVLSIGLLKHSDDMTFDLAVGYTPLFT